jgi:hypothetical protein
MKAHTVEAAAGSAARPQRLPDLRGLSFLGGLAAIGVGVWLDRVSYEISGPGLSAPWQTRGIDLGAGRVSLGAAAVSAAVGVAGMASVLSQRVAGLLLIGGAMAVVVAVLSFMADVEDKPLETTAAGVTVEASLAAGGPVTLVGAGALTVASLLFLWDRA